MTTLWVSFSSVAYLTDPRAQNVKNMHLDIWTDLDLTCDLNLKCKAWIRCDSMGAFERRLAHLATVLSLRDDLGG